jgi:hypothetical protein
MNETASPAASFSRSVALRRIALFGGAGLVALAVIANGLSGIALRNGNPTLALALWPVSSSAAALRAEHLANQGQFPAAQALAVRALRTAPLNSVALRVIVRTAQQRKDTALAEAGLVLAARSGWRDGFAQLWLLDRALAERDYTTAARAADALLRIRFADAQARAAIAKLTLTPDGRTALAERIAARPPWASVVLRDLRGATPQQAEAAAALLIALDERGIRPDEKDIRPLIDNALAYGQGDVMQRLWRRLDPTIVADADSGLNDGDFTQLASDSTKWQPFGWSMTDTPDIRVETPSRSEYQMNPVLRIEGEGSRPGAAVTQLLTLRSGLYTLGFQYKFETGLRQAFVWQVQCIGQSSRLLYGVAVPITSGQGWEENRLQFRVPEQCPGQRIALLVRPSPVGLSAAAFDSVRISSALRP